MQFFKNPNIDFLSKRWYFLGLSVALMVAGLVSIFFGRGVPLSIDFRGGTLITVKFAHPPDYDQVRGRLDAAKLVAAQIQSYGPPENNEVLIALDLSQTNEQSLDQGRSQIVTALQGGQQEKPDLNNTGAQVVADYLVANDPVRAGTDAGQRYAELGQQVIGYRDRTLGGVLSSFDQLKAAVPEAVVESLRSGFSLSEFNVRTVDIVGPQVGQQLQSQARLAVVYSLIGMLVYIAFRFELIYGISAVAAVAHDTLITLGAFSLLNKEVSLTVIAALLTLVGYSMNDTIVVFDRIRENVKLLRRETYAEIVNKSINQTLNRTVLTSGLTFLTVLSLYLFGGEVLHGFSFALVIGILIGTYSSIFVAAPMLVEYQQRRGARRPPVAPPGAATRRESSRPEKVRAKG